MSPVLVNGRSLGVAHNGVFTAANTDPIPGGRLWPEAALTWNAMRADAIRDGIPADEFMPAGPNSSARSLEAQHYFFAHRPPPAAEPGTSNHGYGIAVDVEGTRARAWIKVNGHRYGWSWDEGQRVGEDWHFRYVGASKATLKRLRRTVDPLAVLTATERRWCREYDRLKTGRRNVARRRELRRAMTRQRKRIYLAGQHEGWDKAHRRERYRALLARTR